MNSSGDIAASERARISLSRGEPADGSKQQINQGTKRGWCCRARARPTQKEGQGTDAQVGARSKGSQNRGSAGGGGQEGSPTTHRGNQSPAGAGTEARIAAQGDAWQRRQTGAGIQRGACQS